MENYEVFKKLESFQIRLNELEDAIDVEKLKSDIALDESLIASPTFYQDMNKAQKVLKKVKVLKDNLQTFYDLRDLVSELELYYDMQKSKEVLEEEIDSDVKNVINKILYIILYLLSCFVLETVKVNSSPTLTSFLSKTIVAAFTLIFITKKKTTINNT